MKMVNWLKGVYNRLIGKNEIETTLRENTAISEKMYNKILLWSDMFADMPPWKNENVHTLNLPAIIAAKIAKMVTIESKMNITGGKRADLIKMQMEPLWENIRIYTEYAVAKGGIIFKPYISEDHIVIDCIQADRFYPISFDSNGKIMGAIFIAQLEKGKNIYTRLEKHLLNGTEYTITNTAYKSAYKGILGTPCSLSAVEEWADIQPSTTINDMESPLFVYCKMPFANNIDDSSPLGVSIYAKAAQTIEQADKQYSRLLWEMEGGELAIHAHSDLLHQYPDKSVRLPHNKERLYRFLDEDINGKSLFEVFSPNLRDQSLLNVFNTLLKEIEQQCGLAFGTLSDPQSVDKTATEVMHSKQESYSTVKDIQKSLETALISVADTVDTLMTLCGFMPEGKYEIAFDWDDSIIVDKEAKKALFWQYVIAGKFPMWRYLKEFESYTEKEAKEIVREADENMPQMFEYERA